MFPIGRYLALPSDGIFPENPEELSVGYVFNDPECGDGSDEYSNAIVHAFQGFRAPFSGKIVHIFPEQSAAFN